MRFFFVIKDESKKTVIVLRTPLISLPSLFFCYFRTQDFTFFVFMNFEKSQKHVNFLRVCGAHVKRKDVGARQKYNLGIALF